MKREMIMKIIFTFIKKIGTTTLIAVLSLLGFIPLIVVSIISKQSHMKTPNSYIYFPILLFFIGLSGLPIILRKELPLPIKPIRGWFAIIFGIIFMILCWSFMIYLLLKGLAFVT